MMMLVTRGIASIAQKGLESSRAFHLFNGNEKRLKAAEDTLDALAQQDSVYQSVERFAEVAASSDSEVCLKQHQALLEAITKNPVLGPEPVVGLAGLALHFVRALPETEQAGAADRVLETLGEQHQNPLLIDLGKLPPDLQTLEFVAHGARPADALGTNFLTAVYRNELAGLAAEERMILEEFQEAGVAVGDLLVVAASEDRSDMRSQLYLRSSQRDGIRDMCAEQLAGTGWDMLYHRLEPLCKDEDPDLLEAVFRASAGGDRLNRERLVEGAENFKDFNPKVAVAVREVILAERPSDADDLAQALGLDDHQRLALLTQATPQDHFEAVWEVARESRQGEDLEQAAATLLVERGQAAQSPAEKAMVAFLSALPEKSVSVELLFEHSVPASFEEMGKFVATRLERFDGDKAIASLAHLGVAFEPLVSSQEQRHCIEILEKAALREYHDPDADRSWRALAQGLQALVEPPVQVGRMASEILEKTHFWRDVTPLALDALAALEKIYPTSKELYQAIGEADTALLDGDQGERNRFHKGVFSALADNPQAGYSQVARGIRRHTEQALSDVKTLGALAKYKSRGRNAESYMARLSHEIATTPLENISERLEALNDLLHAEYEGGAQQRLALACLQASEKFDDSLIEGREIARRGLELGAEFATQNQDRVARVALEESLKLSAVAFDERSHGATVPRVLLKTFAASDRLGPADLARAGADLWEQFSETDRHGFLPVLKEGLIRLAEAAGDADVFPPRLEGLTYENAATTLQELADFRGEPYWGSVTPKEDVGFEFGENEVVIGDVPLPRE